MPAFALSKAARQCRTPKRGPPFHTPFDACVLECAGAPALSIDQTSIDLAVGIDSAVAQKWPMSPLLVDPGPVDLCRHNLFLVDRTFTNDFAVRSAHEALPPKFNAIPACRRFVADTV